MSAFGLTVMAISMLALCFSKERQMVAYTGVGLLAGFALVIIGVVTR